MHEMKELAPWDRMLKELVWQQLGDLKGLKILDFGSGEGITANHLARNNEVTAVEPSDDMLRSAWKDHTYKQITGDVRSLSSLPNETFDMIICHNVLEYIDNKADIIRELSRLLKEGGVLSLVKHNRPGRVMQMAVLLDDMEKANDLLDGKNSIASSFGPIRYYEDEDVSRWAPDLSMRDCYGIRTFWDLQQNQEKHADEAWQGRMLQLERRVSQVPAYRDIAFFHHILFVKQNQNKLAVQRTGNDMNPIL